MFADWQSKFGVQLQKNVVLLTGETSADLKLLAKVFILLITLQCVFHGNIRFTFESFLGKCHH